MRQAALLAFLLAAAGPAAGQDMGWSTIIPSVTGTDLLGLQLRQRLQQPAPPAARPASLRYTPSPARRRANLAQFLERARATDPAGAQSLAALFAQGDILERIGAAMAPLNLRVDDLGDAYAVWWITLWQASQGRHDDPDVATAAAVRAQAAGAMAGIPALAEAPDASRQQLAESLLLQAMLIGAALDQARSPEALREAAAAAHQAAAKLGLELRGLRLTRRGFVPG
jgi:GNAT superfamily N-acetyltransferase